MKITSLYINGFGKFRDKAIDLTDGINVIYGNNEAGKSTTHTFIRSMLFGMKKKSGKQDTFEKYKPWDTAAKYEGHLSFVYKDKEYQIYRRFSVDKPLLEIRDLKGSVIDKPEIFLNKVMYNLNSDSFDSSISIAQMKTAQDISMVYELQKYIANLNMSGDMNIDTMAAINYLKHQKEAISISVSRDASINYNRQLGNIKNLEKELTLKNYENKLPDILSKKKSDENKIKKNNLEIDKLKNDIATNTINLENYGFSSKQDIDLISTKTNQIFLEYAPLIDKHGTMSKILLYLFTMILGLSMVSISLILLVVTYPDVASIMNVKNATDSLAIFSNFVMGLSFHPIILISLLLCIGIITIIGSLVMLFIKYQNIQKAKSTRDVLEDILLQQINTDDISVNSIKNFRKHINAMRKLMKSINDDDARIRYLTKENNDLLEKQTEYDQIIREQQKIQYDVEQKYTELYRLKKENEKVRRDIEQNEILNKEIDSIDLAIDTLSSLSKEIKMSFGVHLNDAVSKYVVGLTDGKYSSMNVDNSLSVTVNYEGKVIPLYKLSTGTADQIYLAMRLATTDIIRGDKEALPLIFDDYFSMYDNDRLKAALRFLHETVKTQIILFTCHTRERAFLGLDQIKFNKIDI